MEGVAGLRRFFIAQNDHLEVTEYRFASGKLSRDCSGFRIVHLSDLHGKRFGDSQQILADRVELLRPNLIFFTGDLIDSTRGGEEAGLLLMERLTRTAPVYYVSGNHEWRAGKFERLADKLAGAGVHVLRNERKIMKVGQSDIHLLGIDDPMRMKRPREEKRIVAEDIRPLVADIDVTREFTILLSHRPDMLDIYARHGIDLTFSGHAHGGQFRLPLIGGLYAPQQGLFPRYTEGQHRRGSSELIINRGLGNSGFPQRLFNRPEIVLLELQGEQGR